LLINLSDVDVSIRVFVLVGNSFNDIDAVNRIRAFDSYRSIITKANIVDKNVSDASIVTLLSKLAVTMLA
jgi:hypothetical protein